MAWPSVISAENCLSDFDCGNRLHRNLVERLGTIPDLGKIYGRKVDAADRTVVHRTVVYYPVGHIRHSGPLRCAGDIGCLISLRGLDTYRNVEIVEYMEALHDSLNGALLLGG